MAFQYFSDKDILATGDTTLATVGYDTATRSVIVAGMPPRFRARLPGGMGGITPLTSIRADLGFLNTVDRLDDGSIPLKIWLRAAVDLAGGQAEAELLRHRYDDIEIRTTGGPRIDASQLPELKEVLVHRDDMLPYVYMQRGIDAAGAVAKLSVPRHNGGKPALKITGETVIHLGTGWLMAPGLILTNYHVINAREEGEPSASENDLRLQAAATVALFDFNGDQVAGKTAKLTELVAWDATLDYALLRLETSAAGRVPLLLGQKLTPMNGAGANIAVNIIQHPGGLAKKFGIRNNLLTAANDTELRYFTDTLGGSSGSPVLNDRWEAIALHRGAVWVKGVKFNGRDVGYVNVGTQISAILQDLAARYAGKIPELQI
jgi:V8-like Glu-specific endopeptidase